MEFLRTPKHSLEGTAGDWSRSSYRGLRRRMWTAVEMLLGIYFTCAGACVLTDRDARAFADREQTPAEVLVQRTLRGDEYGVRTRAGRIREQEPGLPADAIFAVVGEHRGERHAAFELERAERREPDAVLDPLEIEPRDPEPSG
jgi:hypothetical protein